MIKVNDVIEAKMSIDAIDEKEVEVKNDISMCKRRFYIRYFINNEWVSDVDFEVDFDEYIEEYDDIEEFLKNDIKISFEEVAEYEIFDVDKKDYLSQKAKIRVIKLK